MSAKKISKKATEKASAKKARVKKARLKKAGAKKTGVAGSAKKTAKKKAARKTAAKKKTTKKTQAKTVAKKRSTRRAAVKKRTTRNTSTRKKAASTRGAASTAKRRSSKSKTSRSHQLASEEAPPLLPSLELASGIFPKDERYLARVVVFGGGIAGLTAAQELSDRGFRVLVIEPQQAIDRFGHETLALGGMARTQYLRVPFEAGAKWWTEPGKPETNNADQTKPSHHWPALPAQEVPAREEGGFSVIVKNPLRPLRRSVKKQLDEHVEVLKHIAAPDQNQGRPCPMLVVTALPEGDRQRLEQRRLEASDRAALVKDYIVEQLGVPERLVNVFIAVSQNDIENESHQVGNPKPGTPWVGVRLDESVLPGEHGFRFFPSYYRHMFDTMHRIPLRDDDGLASEFTVYDNLRSARIEAFATNGKLPVITTRSADLSPTEQMRALMLQIQAGEFDGRDIQQFLGRLLRYMCACPDRRTVDYDNISWWQFIAAYDKKLGVELLKYSDNFEHTVKFSGKVLAAFDADRGDAHTNGDTYIQLFLSTVYKNQSNAVDATLNAPTSEALFKPWREHLESIGTVFINGQVTEFKVEDDKAVAYVVWGPDRDTFFPIRLDAEYYVMATDVVTAESVTQTLPPVGVPGDLRGYTTTVYRGPDPPSNEPIEFRDPYTQPGLTGWDRLQTLAGLQYFFPSDFKLVFGHIYFTDAPWALSSITEPVFWRHAPSLAQNGYKSLISVDVGSWRAPGTKAVDEREAWQCSMQEIGEEVWRQIEEALRAIELGSPVGTIAMPQPTWFHIDSSIQFNENGPVANRTPFLVPMVSDWKNRPGTRPWVPTGPNVPIRMEEKGIWQSSHGGYQVHWDRLVFAGTYLKTTTRMTTMESANESARHATNAIIDHYVHTVGAKTFEQSASLDDDPAPGTEDSEANSSAFIGEILSTHHHLNNAGAPVTSGTPGEQSPIFPTTWIADYCQIWNPENFEPPDLRPLRDLDAKLFHAGLPHLFDVMGLEPAINLSRLGHVGGLAEILEDAAPMLDRLRKLIEQAGNDGPPLEDLLAKLSPAAPEPGSTSQAPNPLDPFGIGDLLHRMASQDAPTPHMSSAGAGTAEPLQALNEQLGLEGWEKFLEFLEAVGGSAGDAAKAQADVLRTLQKLRNELENELLGPSDNS